VVPRYLVERVYPAELPIRSGADCEAVCREIAERAREIGVTWLHSYVSDDRRLMFCLYESPGPEAIRKAAKLADLPVERITRVSVLSPYAYR
jgi:hypothetical protein